MQHILGLVPEAARGDMRYKLFKELGMGMIKDVALWPDKMIIPMLNEAARAFDFVADGDLEELEKYLAERNDDDS